MQKLPSGTVTFVFSDIEGSTRLLEEAGHRYPDLLDRHRDLVREALHRHGGIEIGTEGDAFFMVFASAVGAANAAVEIQRGLAAGSDPIRLRMGLHTGEATLRGDDYVGLDVHRAARIAASGHGGQVLLSESTRSLVAGDLPGGVTVRDLGEHRLKDLRRTERLYQLVIEGLESTFPPLRSADTAGNLPLQATSFIGREPELDEGERLLDGTRLLTLTGPGGTGKTRLAVRLADRLRPRFSGGVWFVGLAAVTEAELLPSAISAALGIAEAQGNGRSPVERLVDHLKEREVLLLLDNFEQILPAAPVVADVLRAAPGVKVVVTSRAPLHVYGEREFPVPPLRLPDPRHLPDLQSLSQFEAVRLFIDRATAVKPTFEVTNENAPAVAEICARLDGLPLAIELAAARVRLLSPEAMLARLGVRLDLLTGGARDLPARQQTLRQAIAWSYDLLSEPERRLFARLAAFTGGASLEDAEAVAGGDGDPAIDVFEGLTLLAEHSLVRVADDGPRFEMLETIREFALERLEESGEAEAIRRRHAETFLALAEAAEPHVTGRDRKRWLPRLEAEHDNFRGALEWAIHAGSAPLALRLVAALWRFLQTRGHLQEGTMWTERVLALPGVEEHPRERLKALEAAGGIAYWRQDADGQRGHYEEALSVAEQIGDPSLVAGALYNASFPHVLADPELARERLERSLSMYRDLGDRAGQAKALWGMGNLHYAAESYDEAARYMTDALAGAREAGDDFHVGWSLFMLGSVEKRLGRYDRAVQWWRETLRHFADADDLTGILFVLDGMSEIALRTGRAEQGIRLAAASTKLRTSTGADLVIWERQLAGDPDRPDLPEADLRRLWEEGAAMSLEEATAYALQEG